MTVEEEVEREKDGEVVMETEEVEKVVGFYAAPVFRYEDTEDEPLPDPDYAPPELPPLVEVAEQGGDCREALNLLLRAGRQADRNGKQQVTREVLKEIE